MDLKLKQAEQQLLEREHLCQRLRSIFSSILPSRPGDRPGSLFTKTLKDQSYPSLVVYFDHGIDPDPAFSGPCLARIYVDEAKEQLCLAIWPQDRKKKGSFVRHEILLDQVSSADFYFLTRKLDQSIDWEKERSAEEKREPPCLIRLDLWQKNTSLEKKPSLQFMFHAPSTELEILYSGRQGA